MKVGLGLSVGQVRIYQVIHNYDFVRAYCCVDMILTYYRDIISPLIGYSLLS